MYMKGVYLQMVCVSVFYLNITLVEGVGGGMNALPHFRIPFTLTLSFRNNEQFMKDWAFEKVL